MTPKRAPAGENEIIGAGDEEGDWNHQTEGKTRFVHHGADGPKAPDIRQRKANCRQEERVEEHTTHRQVGKNFKKG